MPTDILIYAIVAAVMIFWLRSVLGTRHGEERERPNPFEQKPEVKVEPVTPSKVKSKPALPLATYDKNITGKDSGLVQIALADRDFDVEEFKSKAKEAFIIIVEAFAKGDKDTLRDLCADDVYNAFVGAIDDREKAGETVSTDIHAVRKIDVVNAGLENKRNAFVTLKITADETYVIRDKQDKIIAGHPNRITEMTDLWTFSRDVKSRDPRWLLSKTEDGEVEEDGKTPLPDAG
jgi:predicted lipid-binding transport protein (Tim44 family)